ncbi:MAG: FIST C-terminal domain-containing protein [Coriobacteriales bacterium]|jgi:hypothetical protein|nr:FIST C-terminal domain-containing protein [Coriobacteriales bacterium]
MAIRTFVAVTEEVDDIDDAWADISTQIDFLALDSNSVGIITCYYDFIESGLLAELNERLPFETIGTTSMSAASSKGIGVCQLILMVLTGDDVCFSTAQSAPLGKDDYRTALAQAFDDARSRLSCEPVFAISYLPYLHDISGAQMLQTLDEAAEGRPVWGGIASGVDMTYAFSTVLHNGSAKETVCSLLLIGGAVEPEFVVTSIPSRNVFESKALVTSSEESLIREINGIAAQEYFRSIGIQPDDHDTTTIPIIVDSGDGSKPVALAMYGADENGAVLCGGFVPQGSTLSIAGIDREGILDTAQASLDELAALDKHSGLLLMPCVTRYIMLAPNPEAEMELALKYLSATEPSLPYYLGYAGGELCPVKAGDGKYHNRFHNFTFSACIL